MCGGGGGTKKPVDTGPPVTNNYGEYQDSQRQAGIAEQNQYQQPSFGSELTGSATATQTTGGQ